MPDAPGGGATYPALMNASMFVAGWDDVPCLGPLSARVPPAARVTRPPEGFAHHGVGGDALSTELARMLAYPELERAVSVTFVPFALDGGLLRHATDEGEHLAIEAERLRAAWPAEHDDAYRLAVQDACRAVRRGAPTAMEHVLWLEHFLVERLLRVAAPLELPVLVIWPERRSRLELERALDGALESWTG